jgi:SNF family Na+-dependent transporter
MIVIFVGWFMGKENVRTEITNNGELKGRFFGIFMFILRIVAPVAIALVFLIRIETKAGHLQMSKYRLVAVDSR